jgi:hypothetical protein
MTTFDRQSREDFAKKNVGEKVIVILASELDLNSHVLTLQDFIREGKKVIPFFSSKEALNESTGGVNLGKPLIQIDRRFFINMIHPQENFVFNIGLKSEMTFTGDELKNIFPEPFDLSIISKK